VREIRACLTALILTSGLATALILTGLVSGDDAFLVPLILVGAIVAQWKLRPKRKERA
jgi:hypothetical protein